MMNSWRNKSCSFFFLLRLFFPAQNLTLLTNSIPEPAAEPTTAEKKKNDTASLKVLPNVLLLLSK